MDIDPSQVWPTVGAVSLFYLVDSALATMYLVLVGVS